MTINARALEHAITKMLSHPLKEVQQVGMGIKQCASAEVPTLLKYADEDKYLQEAPPLFQINGLLEQSNTDWCRLMHYTPDVESRLLAAALYRYNKYDYAQCMGWVKDASLEEKTRLAGSLISPESCHFNPLRELEHAIFTFDITIDQGAYYEVKRHRMMTLTAQPLGTGLGYAIPLMIEKAGVLDEYIACMQQAERTYDALAQFNRDAAAYIVPNACNRRFLLTSNLRSLLHFIKLRGAPNAHFSVRRLAQQMAAELRQTLPVFSQFLDICPQENVKLIESRFFHETQKRDL
jgi:thymidylate synthase ThyX